MSVAAEEETGPGDPDAVAAVVSALMTVAINMFHVAMLAIMAVVTVTTLVPVVTIKAVMALTSSIMTIIG
ncbi:MAG: hypothetical protein C0616_02910 [Desulfuromonas sp.]|nr:MAG: hypothetical protein C0616_02910 [Desulfuromonas sp.]